MANEGTSKTEKETMTMNSRAAAEGDGTEPLRAMWASVT